MATKGRRVTVDLNPLATAELDRLSNMTGLGTSDLLRFSVTLLRIYVDTKAEGKELRVVNPKDPQDQLRLEFPITVHRLDTSSHHTDPTANVAPAR